LELDFGARFRYRFGIGTKFYNINIKNIYSIRVYFILTTSKSAGSQTIALSTGGNQYTDAASIDTKIPSFPIQGIRFIESATYKEQLTLSLGSMPELGLIAAISASLPPIPSLLIAAPPALTTT
jgi:hypothetical protein